MKNPKSNKELVYRYQLPVLISLFLLPTIGCVINRPTAYNVATEAKHCLLHEGKGPVQMGFPMFQAAIADFNNSKATQEAIVIRITPGKSTSVCRRLIQTDSYVSLITVREEGGKTDTTQFGGNASLSELLSLPITGSYDVINLASSAHVPLNIISVKSSGITKCSLVAEEVECLLVEDQQKVQHIYDLLQYILSL